MKKLGNLLGILGTGAKMAAAMPFNVLSGKAVSDAPIRTEATWDEEKEDILERANWLCKKVMVEPEQLISEAPALLGEEYQGQWAIYSCSMLAHALANISVIYPEKRAQCPQLIANLIDKVNTPEMRHYDTIMWHEDAMQTLSKNSGHMTYLSILAWMISNYKLIGGDNRYDALFDTLCETLNRRMYASPYDLNMLSFPGKQVFIPDMIVTIIALHNYARLNNGKYESSVQAWLQNAKTKWIHKKTGLLAGMLPGAKKGRYGMTLRGSYAALSSSYLSLVDESFAKEQHERMKSVFRHETEFLGTKVCGVKEYLNKLPELSLKGGDAGIIFKGISAGGCAFALGSATYFGDWEFRSQLLRTAEVGGQTVKEERMRHYRLGEFALVGEATALAMRTNVKR